MQGSAKQCTEHGEDEYVSPTQPLDNVDDEAAIGEPDEGDSSVSSDSDSEPEQDEHELLTRFTGGWPGKQPVKRALVMEEEDDADEQALLDAAPDVGAYLAPFNLHPTQQIRLCRSWANYLAAQTRPKKYNKTVKKPE